MAARNTHTFLAFFALFFTILFSTTDAFTEIFSLAKDENDNSFYVGNQNSNFFIGKRDQFCGFEWTSSDGSTTGDDDNDANQEIFYGISIGNDDNIYAVGSTRGDFDSPADELPNLDAALVVYNPANGAAIRRAQYDIVSGFDNIASSIVQKSDGKLLVAVYGTVSNVDSTAVFETRLLQIDPTSLSVEVIYPVVVTTTEAFPVSGGPKILDFTYDESTDSVVAIGHILGRGILWRYSLATLLVTSQAEWGRVFGSYQISGFTSDGAGAFFVVGSSPENVLGNTDLLSTVSSEFHAYVIRFDLLTTASTSATWVRQLNAAGSSQSGNDITIDPVTQELVAIGTFDMDFEIFDSQTAQAFRITAAADNGLTDIFIWVLNADNGDYADLRISTVASTASEDRANVVQVLSNRRVDIGGVLNDGTDANPLVCDETKLLISPSPSVTPSTSATVSPSATPSLTSSPSSSASESPSSSASPSLSPSASISPSVSVSPSVSSSASASPVLSGTPSMTAGISPLATGTPSVGASTSAAALGTVSSSPFPSVTVDISLAPSPAFVPSFSVAPSASTIGTPAPSASATFVATPTLLGSPAGSTPAPTLVISPSATVQGSDGAASEATPSATGEASVFPIATVTPTTGLVVSPLASQLPVPTVSIVFLPLISATPSTSADAIPSASATVTGELVTLISATPSSSAQNSVSASATVTGVPVLPLLSATPSSSAEQSPSASAAFSGGLILPLVSVTPSSSVRQSPSASAVFSGGLVLPLISATPSSSVRQSPSASATFSGGLVLPLISATPSSSVRQSPSASAAFSGGLVLPLISATPSASTEVSPSASSTSSAELVTVVPTASTIPSPSISESLLLPFISATPSSSFQERPSASATNTEGTLLPIISATPSASTTVIFAGPPEIATPSPDVVAEQSSSPLVDIEQSAEPSTWDLYRPSPGDDEGMDVTEEPSSSAMPDNEQSAEPSIWDLYSPSPGNDEGMDITEEPSSSAMPDIGQSAEPSTWYTYDPSPDNDEGMDVIEETSSSPVIDTEPSAEPSTWDTYNPFPSNEDENDLQEFEVPSPLFSSEIEPSVMFLPSNDANVLASSRPESTEVDGEGLLPIASMDEIDGIVTDPEASVSTMPLTTEDPVPSATLELTQALGTPSESLDEVFEDGTESFGPQDSVPEQSPFIEMEMSYQPVASATPEDGQVLGSPNAIFPDEGLETGMESLGPEEVLEQSPFLDGETQISHQPSSGLPDMPAATEEFETEFTIPPRFSLELFPNESIELSHEPISEDGTPGASSEESPGPSWEGTSEPSDEFGDTNEDEQQPPQEISASASVSATVSPTAEPTLSPNPRETTDVTLISTPEPTRSNQIPLSSLEAVPTKSGSPSASGEAAESPTQIPEPTGTVRPAKTPTPTATFPSQITDTGPTRTPTPTATFSSQVASVAPTRTPTPTATFSSQVASVAPTRTPTPTATFSSQVIDFGPTRTPTPTATFSSQVTDFGPTRTPTPTATLNPQFSTSSSPSFSPRSSQQIAVPEESDVFETGSAVPSASTVEPVSQSFGPQPSSSSAPVPTASALPSSSLVPTPAAPFESVTNAPISSAFPSTPSASRDPNLEPTSTGSGLIASPDLYPSNTLLSSPEDDAWSSPEAEISVVPTISPMGTNEPSNSPVSSQQPVPTFACNHYDLVHELKDLNDTNNYVRVSMVIQVAGPNLTNTCGLRSNIVERFVNFSALNTQSKPEMWYVTKIEDGPPIYSIQASLVTIEEPDSLGVVNQTIKVSPSPTIENKRLFPGSVIFGVIVYLPPLSVDLALGSYIDYVMSQRIVDALQAQGYRDIEWTGMLTSPQVMDTKTTDSPTSEEKDGSRAWGIVAGVVGLTTLGMLAFLVTVDGAPSAVWRLFSAPPPAEPLGDQLV